MGHILEEIGFYGFNRGQNPLYQLRPGIVVALVDFSLQNSEKKLNWVKKGRISRQEDGGVAVHDIFLDNIGGMDSGVVSDNDGGDFGSGIFTRGLELTALIRDF